MKLYFLFTMAFLWLWGLQAVYPSNFTGRVTDPDDKPLVGATVEIEAAGLIESTFTNQYGYFQFSGINPGAYLVTVSYLGYQTIRLTKDIKGEVLQQFVLFQETITLKEVKIEDNHHEKRARERTLSVELAGADFVRVHNRGSLMHTLSRLPGIQAVSVGSGQSKPLIRGLGFNRIVVAEHGLKHEGQQWGADHALEVDQFAYDYIELIKGPSSLAYGSDAIGGVVVLGQRRTPAAQSLSAHIDLVGRSSNRLMGTSVALEGRKQQWFFTSRITWLDYADARVPVDSVDVYSFRVPLYKNRLRNTAGNELNLHLSLGYAGNNLNSRFYISNVQQQSGFFANAHGLEPRRVDTELYDRSDREILYPRQEARHFKLANRTMIAWGNTLWISEMGYQHNFREEFSQYVNHGYRPSVFPDTLSIPADLERSFDKHTLSANIRAETQLTEAQLLTAGLSAEYQDNSIGGINFLMPAFRQWLAGLYLLHEWRLPSSLRINAGIRYDQASLNSDPYHDWFPTHGHYLQRAAALHRQFGSISGMLGMNYQKENSVLRLNLGRSFRVPLAKELAANGVNYHHFSYEVGDASLQPETAWQIDLGAEHMSTAWSVRVSPFLSYFPNYIYLNPSHLYDFDYGAGNQVFNYTAAEVFRWGGEVALHGDLAENLSVELTAEYTYSEQLSGAKKGFTIPFSPPASFLAGVSWTPYGNIADGNMKYVTFVADARITASQNRIVPPETKTPAYKVFNLGVTGKMQWNKTAVNWNVMVNNLLNAQYYEHTSYYRLIGIPEPGRNITISVNVPVNIIR